jgi:hypothetical protein
MLLLAEKLHESQKTEIKNTFCFYYYRDGVVCALTGIQSPEFRLLGKYSRFGFS